MSDENYNSRKLDEESDIISPNSSSSNRQTTTFQLNPGAQAFQRQNVSHRSGNDEMINQGSAGHESNRFLIIDTRQQSFQQGGSYRSGFNRGANKRSGMQNQQQGVGRGRLGETSSMNLQLNRHVPPPITTTRPQQGYMQYAFNNSIYSGAQSAQMYRGPSSSAFEGVQRIWGQGRINKPSQMPQISQSPSYQTDYSHLRMPLSAVEASTQGSYGLFSGLQHPSNFVSIQSAREETSFAPLRSAGPTATVARWNVGAIGRTSNYSSSSASSAVSSETKPSILEKLPFPERPEIGSKGKLVRVRVNFFEFTALPGQAIFQYELKIHPEVPPSLNRKVFKELIIKHGREKFGGVTAVFDGKKFVYCPRAIPIGDDGSFELEILVSDDPLPSVQKSDSVSRSSPRKFNVILKPTSVIDMQGLTSFINGQTMWAPIEALQALDALMRHRPSMNLTAVGRSFFTRNDSKLLGDGAECWMGYHQSVRPAKGKLLMNIDVSATAFFEPSPLIDFVAKNLGKRNADELKAPLRIREIEKIERLLKGVKIKVCHSGEIKRKYKILGFTKSTVDQTFFKYSSSSRDPSQLLVPEQTEISVEEYFRRQYNYHLKFSYLPCVKVGSLQRAVYLPLEVCEILPGQRYLKKLNESQTARMIKLTCQTPDKRANSIAQAISELGLDNVGEKEESRKGSELESERQHPESISYLDSFGVKISDEMMIIPARILDPPTIQYHPTSREPLITPRKGAWNLKERKVVQPATLHSWAVVCFGTSREMPQSKVDHFLRDLISTCKDTGLDITNVHPPAVYGDPKSNIDQTIQIAWQAAGEATQSFPQLILCILPDKGVPLYAEIKRVGDTVLGVPTQCVNVKQTFQKNRHYCANLCLKINAKLGGVNSFIVKNPSISGDVGLPWISDVPTIIFGADITHPAHGEARSSGSVCALVGSLDRLASRYAATVRLQPPRREVIQDLSSMVQELLRIFYVENNQIAPQRILFYRDGVSESQFHEVVQAEIKSIRLACDKLQLGYKPTITYVVVQKRNHARIFPMNIQDSDEHGNIQAGTVIDSHITHPNEYDFFLCSHAGLQGTSRPTHYHVLHDENRFTPDTLQELTNRLCYGYARCTRSVSVVPPAYYADLVAFRAKYHMKSAWSGMGNVGSAPSDSIPATSSFIPETPVFESDPHSAEGDERSETTSVRLTSRRKKRDVLTKEEEEELMKKLQAKLVPVKPELQKVMYFM